MLDAIFLRADGLDTLRIAVAGASTLSAVVYLPILTGAPSPHRTAIKTFTIAILAVLPLIYLGQGHVWPLLGLSLALSLSALGDFFLALKDQGRFFVPGLASFLAAHVAYVAIFLPYAAMPQGGALAIIVLAVMAAGAFIVTITPKLGKLRLPVIAYFAVIMAMVATAWSIREASWILGTGALVFALSDSLIAVRKFLAPFPGINQAVWITYVAAQFMIVLALLALLLPVQVG
jgi:uncharacterized membrane protein YhhN